MADLSTREFCQRCHRVSPIGFYVPDEIWAQVAGRIWRHSILCVLCFAELGDEKHIEWEDDIQFFPVSYATHHAGRETEAPSGDPNEGHATENTEDIQTLAREINRLRDAGTELCIRALRVVVHGDGLHRLAASSADWCETLASAFGRPDRRNPAQ